MHQTQSPLSLDEHRELAGELQAANSRMRELCNVVAGTYGADSRATFTFLRAAEWIDCVRREMQQQAERDLPGLVGRLYL